MKPLSVEMACLLGIQNEIQAVCNYLISCIFWELFALFCKNRQGLPVSAVCFATLAFTVLKVILKVTKIVLK